MRSFFCSFPFVSVWCALAVFVASCFPVTATHAAEFKPFLTLKIAGPGTIVNLAEKISGIADPSGTLGVKAMLAPYKNLPGVNVGGTIGLALQVNENSPLGVDLVAALPIANLETFSIPGQEMTVGLLKSMLQKEGSYSMISSPFGEFVAYQKTGYFVMATMEVAAVAQAADPKAMFANLDKFTLGAIVDLENISLENVESILGSLSFMLATQGMETNPDALLEQLSGYFEEFSSMTFGATMDERTLTLTGSMQTVPKRGSETAEKLLKVKNAKTMFSGFLHDTAKTVFSWSTLDYWTDREHAGIAEALQLTGESFLEGLRDTDEDHGERFVRFAEIVLEWLQENVEFLCEQKSVDAAMALDSDGTFLYAQATGKPELATKIGDDLYYALPELFEEGQAWQTHLNSKMRQNYETVEGFSLSCLSNLFTELPPGVVVPRALRDWPVSLLWATKEGEAVAVAVGLDFARTERTLKAALDKTKTPTSPKQTGVFALKPLGEFLMKHILPIAEKSGMLTKDNLEDAKEILAVLASAESSAKIVVTTEFPGEAQLQKYQMDGKCLNVVLKMMTKQAELGAKRAVRESLRQQQETIGDF